MLAIGAVPAARLLTRSSPIRAASKPDSRIGGVQVGLIAPYAFRGTAQSAEEILAEEIVAFDSPGHIVTARRPGRSKG